MYVEQMYTNCLAEAAYWIESEGEAVVIDPIRETAPYIAKAKERGVTIKYIFETHFHADFVSGHIDLSKATGAEIIYGPGADPKYPVHIAHDNEDFQVGKVIIRVLHTPGHTPESSSFLLLDEKGKEHAVFTGDTLFVGDVGRPDLLDGKMSKEELAGMMFDSLKNKIKTLADDVLVYPGHGAGSSCGKNIGTETWSTIGQQKATNYAMKISDKNEFIKAVTDGLSAPPQYFFKDAMINKTGYENIDHVMERNVTPLDALKVKAAVEAGALVLDTRHQDEFEKGFIPGSTFIGLDGTYAVWVGTLVDINTKLVIVASPGKEKEAILRLARVGYENVLGYLEGGMESWVKANLPVDTIKSVDADVFVAEMNKSHHEAVLDVRRPGEWNSGHAEGAQHVCLSNFSKPTGTDSIDKDKPYFVHCAGGYRSMIAISMLKQKGYTNLTNVRGGWRVLEKMSFPKVIAEHA